MSSRENHKRWTCVCDCNDYEHQIHFDYWEENDDADGIVDKSLFLTVHLADKPFWQRLKYGIMYIFGYKSRYGAFDEFVLSKDKHAKVFREVSETLESM